MRRAAARDAPETHGVDKSIVRPVTLPSRFWRIFIRFDTSRGMRKMYRAGKDRVILGNLYLAIAPVAYGLSLEKVFGVPSL